MPKTQTQLVVNVSGEIAAVEDFYFLGVSAGTLKGIFVTKTGKQTGVAVSLTIPLANGSNDPVSLLSVTGGVPSDAVGFIGNFSANTYYGIYNKTNSAALDTDFKANYASYPIQEAANNVIIGSVAVI